MDDFIYGEPQGVPESGGIVLMVLGLGFITILLPPFPGSLITKRLIPEADFLL